MGQLGYLWSVMDIDGSNELTYNEVEQILKNLSLTEKIRDHG